jgi:hypothetical protein
VVTLTSPPFSYHYSFDTDDWNAVYKHTVGKNFKVKAGYDSEVRVGWASLWVWYSSISYFGYNIEQMSLKISKTCISHFLLLVFATLQCIQGDIMFGKMNKTKIQCP